MAELETRERILETALELIWQSNYNSVGVNEICKQTGVSKGAFYHHFESKASLFCEATRYYWTAIKHDLDAIFSPLNTPIQQLENLIAFLLTAKLGDKDADEIHGCPFFTAGAQIGIDEKEVQIALRDISEKAIQYDFALVKALQAGDYLVDKEDPELLARLIYQFIHGVMSFSQLCGDTDYSRQDMPRGLYRLIGLKREFWFATTPTWKIGA
ncbi:TetR family transcriptional regulator [Methylophaga sp. 42_25_T18]|nr:TetR family transcriptional regulator [Methylophaga sp. 42_25_T18]OUR89748.1 TetR family transcriptional regulator [Methylophaga sp. 42_8_T64]